MVENKTIKRRRWLQENAHRQAELLFEDPKTQMEKDIWNLKWMLYSIDKDSVWYNMGIVKTLRRTIERLEACIK